MFEQKVAEHLKKHSGTLSDAMLKVAADRPDLHKDFVARSQAGNVAPQDTEVFEDKVTRYISKHNCTRSEAIREVAAARPDLHEDYIIRAKSGQTKPIKIFSGSGSAESFESLVKECRQKRGCSHGQAVAIIAKENPELHKQYINRVNAR